MAEPVTAASAGVGLSFTKGVGIFKILGIAVFFVFMLFAVAVVVMMRMPKTPREWGVALISTIVSSFGIGAAVITKFSLQPLANDYWGIITIGMIIFICGLPGWALVRWLFVYIDEKDKAGDNIFDVAKDVKNQIK